MANTHEIKNRIRSIQDTQKITNAMYMISSNKLRKAKRELDATRPYFDSLKLAIARMIRHMPEVESPYLVDHGQTHQPTPDSKAAYLVITADKGLAGAYNHNVLKIAQREMERNQNWDLYVVGEYGRQYFLERGVEIERSFLYTAQNPTLHRAREIAYELLERYEAGELSEIYIIYTDMESSVSSEAKMFRLLPLERGYFTPEELHGDVFEGDYEFHPSLQEVLNQMIPSMTSGFIYSSLVDSFCAEQNARMMAMDAANRNAEEMLHDLTIQFNRVRQAMITQEITEIAAGAKAQQKKKSS